VSSLVTYLIFQYCNCSLKTSWPVQHWYDGTKRLLYVQEYVARVNAYFARVHGTKVVIRHLAAACMAASGGQPIGVIQM